ncbi:MAG: diguanylate cyclase domain-containing protein, partial [Parahaliea sp.]
MHPALIDGPMLHGMHNHFLCALAVLIGILAAGSLLPATNRYHRGDPRYRHLWLCSGSLAMGTGIWAMHFTAMLAYRLPTAMHYDVITTLLSIVPAVLASAYCIVTYRSSQVGLSPFNASLQPAALSMAAGIGLMHYLGMEAMRMPADMYYTPELFYLSIAAAYVLACFGLYIHGLANNIELISPRAGVLIGSIVLGMAVSGMHFTAMKATYFVANDSAALSAGAIEPYGLISAIALVAVFLIGLIILGAVIDRRFSQVSQSLHQSELRFSQLAENTQTAIFTFNRQKILYANPALCNITGHSAGSITTLPLAAILGDSFSHLANDLLTPPLLFDKAFHEEFRITTSTGEDRWIYFSITLTQFNEEHLGLASGFDITDKKNAEYSLRELAYNDALTGLFNRAMFINRLDHHLKLIRRDSFSLNSCVMLLDLDSFKSVNDSFGHHSGDELLSAVALRLRNVVRASDTLARLGGDEFVMLFESVSDKLCWSLIADKILAQLALPFELNGKPIDVRASVGVLPLNYNRYDSADAVLRDVDIAMYRAKHYKKSHWVIFDSDLDASSRRLRMLQGELVDA